MDARFRTDDGVMITDGLRVWDYDGKPGTVSFSESRLDRPLWNGWFRVLRDEGGVSLMNGERLRIRRWWTGAAVPAFTDTRRAELLDAVAQGATLHGTQGCMVSYLPRVDNECDPQPWRDLYFRRYLSSEVTVCWPHDKPGDTEPRI